MRFTTDDAASARTARSLGIATEEQRFDRLVGRYRAILNCYSDTRPLIRALLGLHEIENVKLGWRAVARRIDSARWTPLWRDLHELANVSIDAFLQAHTLYDVVERLAKTPFAGIARDVYTAHATDLGSAELSFDRWASLRVVEEAALLQRTESLALQIAEGLVHERDIEIERRGLVAYGLSVEAVEAARVLPRRKRWPDLPLLCRRAFRGRATLLAPAVAYAAFAESDDRIARTLTEREGDSSLDEAVPAFNSTERRPGKTVIRVRPSTPTETSYEAGEQKRADRHEEA